MPLQQAGPQIPYKNVSQNVTDRDAIILEYSTKDTLLLSGVLLNFIMDCSALQSFVCK